MSIGSDCMGSGARRHRIDFDSLRSCVRVALQQASSMQQHGSRRLFAVGCRPPWRRGAKRRIGALFRRACVDRSDQTTTIVDQFKAPTTTHHPNPTHRQGSSSRAGRGWLSTHGLPLLVVLPLAFARPKSFRERPSRDDRRRRGWVGLGLCPSAATTASQRRQQRQAGRLGWAEAGL